MAPSTPMYVWLAALLLCAGQSLAKSRCVPEYNTTSARIPGKINVHLIPHTHDDTGWLKTVDQYYYGAHQEIQMAGVQYVLDTMIYALEKNPDRKFAYAEMSFFTRWWDEQTEKVQESVKNLVKNGQLHFLNGGWVQHDEAAAHYVAMIDQTTRGHRFLEETFGVRPRAGWQIDPFGHSSTQAALMSGYLGFDALFFGRSDYQDLDLRKKSKELEFVWRGAKSFGSDADVFTGSFPTGNYGPPPKLYFEWGNWDPPVQDNICLTEINTDERVNDFVDAAIDMASMYEDKDLYWPMGTDFTYSNAFTWFKNMDKFIHYVNKDGRVNALYSSPEEYVKVKHDLNRSWPLKTDDFFPYADAPTSYWTGYFTSRPASKGYIRQATSYLQLVRQLELLTGTPGASDHLEEAVALLQHHDSITGTEKQAVANDYHKRLAKGVIHAQRFVSKALSHLVYNNKAEATLLANKLMNNREAISPKSEEDPDLLLLIHQCPLLNISVCEYSVQASRKGSPFLVVGYNPLAWSRLNPIRIPIDKSDDDDALWTVTGPNGEASESQVVPVSETIRSVQKTLADNGALPDIKFAASHELVFTARVPPLGFSTFTIGKIKGDKATHKGSIPSVESTIVDWSQDARWNKSLETSQSDTVTFEQEETSVTISASTGRITSFKTRSGKEWDFNIAGAFYRSHNATEGIASGAYIFRPDGLFEEERVVNTITVDGPVVTEIRTTFLDFLSVTTKLWKGSDHLEVQWVAGPIPIDDNHGKEVILKYKSDLKTGSTFQTDSNGREMLTRKIDYRPTWDLRVDQPIAGNYYPLTAAISVKGDEGELSVLVDRAQGGSSLSDGEIEVMVHRRTLLDDIKGVNEPLNETVSTFRFDQSPGLIVVGTHFVNMAESEDAATHRRHLQQLLDSPVLLAFGPTPPDTEDGTINELFSAMALIGSDPGLPDNVHLLTSKLLDEDTILLRLAHLFQVDEDAGDLAKSVDVNVNHIFGSIKFESFVEYGLAGAQPLDKISRKEFKAGKPIHNGKVNSEIATEYPYERSLPFRCDTSCTKDALTVTLKPMEIRTFIGKVAKKPSVQLSSRVSYQA